MKFLIDECLHESLVKVANEAGFEATHVKYISLGGCSDKILGKRALRDEFTFVTNNRLDFLRIFRQFDLHAGLIVIIPNVPPTTQQALFRAALLYVDGRDLANIVVEISIDGKNVVCVDYDLPDAML